MKLTTAQRDALDLLVRVYPDKIGAHKRRTQAEPIPRVNVRAANELAKRGLAHLHIPDSRFWSAYSCDYKFSATQAGIDLTSRGPFVASAPTADRAPAGERPEAE